MSILTFELNDCHYLYVNIQIRCICQKSNASLADIMVVNGTLQRNYIFIGTNVGGRFLISKFNTYSKSLCEICKNNSINFQWDVGLKGWYQNKPKIIEPIGFTELVNEEEWLYMYYM